MSGGSERRHPRAFESIANLSQLEQNISTLKHQTIESFYATLTSIFVPVSRARTEASESEALSGDRFDLTQSLNVGAKKTASRRTWSFNRGKSSDHGRSGSPPVDSLLQICTL